jgi:hydrogenase nickel incorporation protein HypA/HybF
MHEYKLVADALKDVLKTAEENNAKKVSAVRFKVGENCHVRLENIEFLFRQAARGSIAENAKIEISLVQGEDLLLSSIQVD